MASSDSDPVRDVEAAARAGAAAIAANDLEAMAAYLHEDWLIVSGDGPSPRSRLFDLVASGRLAHSAMEWVSEPIIRVVGDVAVVTARITNTAWFGDQRFDSDEWTTDVLVRTASGWRCVQTHVANVASGRD